MDCLDQLNVNLKEQVVVVVDHHWKVPGALKVEAGSGAQCVDGVKMLLKNRIFNFNFAKTKLTLPKLFRLVLKSLQNQYKSSENIL